MSRANEAAGQGSSEKQTKAMLALEKSWWKLKDTMLWSSGVAFQSQYMADPYLLHLEHLKMEALEKEALEKE